MAKPGWVVLGPNGKPVASSNSRRAFDSASGGRRAHGWLSTSAHINALMGDVDIARRRSRDAVRRNPFAGMASDSWVSSAIGKGIRPKPRTENDDLRQQLKDCWDIFVEECHDEGVQDFYGLQSLVGREAYEAGDGLLRFRPRRMTDKVHIPLQLQALEAEHLDSSKHQELGDGGVIRGGVEFGPTGTRRAYWLFRDHPGDSPRTRRGGNVSVPVPADQVIHVFHQTRAGQVRGVPGLARILAILKDVTEVQDAYVLRTKIQNLFATFETSPDTASVFDDQGIEDEPGLDEDDTDVVTVEPGEHRVLPPGHDIKFADPPNHQGGYADFMRSGLRSIAVGAGVTYEQMSGDLSGVNFSSIRAGLIEFRRRVEQYQHNVLVFQLCRPVWRRFFEAAVLSGRILIPPAERSRMRILLSAKWQVPGWEYVEPEKDVRTAVRKIRAGLSSREREAARLGVDVEELDLEIQRDKERADELGLCFDCDPSTDLDGSARASGLAGEGGQDSGAVEGEQNAA